MTKRFLAIVIVTGTILGPYVEAQAAASDAANTPARQVDPRAVEALQKMGAYLQGLKRFHVSTELTGKRVLEDGEKLQHTATADLDVDRPDRIRASMHSARCEREILYDGKTVAHYSPEQKYYTTMPFDGNLSALVQQLRTRYV